MLSKHFLGIFHTLNEQNTFFVHCICSELIHQVPIGRAKIYRLESINPTFIISWTKTKFQNLQTLKKIINSTQYMQYQNNYKFQTSLI